MIRYRTLRPHAISCHYLRSRSNRSSYISNSSCSWSPSSQPAEAGRDDSSELASAVDAAMKTALLYPSNSLPEKTTTPNGTHYGNELKALPALKPRRRKVSSKPKSQSDNTKTKTKTKPNPEPTTLKPQANLLDEILSIAAPTVFSIAKIRQLLRSRLKGLGTTALALVNQVQQAIDPVSDDGSGKTVDKPRRTQDDVSAARPKRNNRETSIFRRIEVAEEPLKTQDDTRPAKSVRNVASSSRSQRLKARRLIVARAKLKATITTTTTTPTTTLTLEADKMEMRGITTDHPPVKKLCYDLDRVLFKQGAYNLQDPRTGVFNFDHYLQHIMPAEEFDFDSLGAFVTSSKDKVLQDIAKKHRKSYVGSTSSMTSVLAQFHFLLSNFRPLNFARISSGFPNPSQTFTEFTRLPAAICLRYKDGVYALDADKSFDRGTILSQLGQSMEKLLLLPQEQYEQYRLSSPDKVPEEVKNTPEAYHYSTIGNFVFRSQLDGHHDWLPGTGIFDVKTRACVTIRMNAANYKEMSGYQIKGLYGEWESFEREYVDMLRSTMLKYSLQVRMGRMDGIFVAFHNTEQIFGFQYIPLSEMDLAIHGQENLALGDQEFKFSVQMFSDILDKVTEAYPNQSVRFHFETRPRAKRSPRMLIFAEPMTEELLDATQVAENERAMQELRREMSGQDALTQNTELPSQNATCAVDEVQGDPIPLQIDDEYFVGISSPNSGTLADITVRDLSNGISLPGQTDDVVLKHPPAQSKSSSNDTIMITPQDSTANQSQAAQEVEDAQVEVASLRDFEPEDTKMIRELSMRTSQEQKEYTINAEVQDPTKAVITDLLVKDEHALVDGQEGEAATQDMATRYVGAAAVFTPDDIAANSILPLVASLELYTGIAGSLGQPVYTTPVATLWREILRQALQSPDPLDGIAAKVHITIESFWNHETVFNGISAMKTGFAVASPEDGETYFQLNNAIGLAVKAARKSEFNASLFKAQVELIEQQKLCTPSNLRSLYLDCLLLKTGRQQTALNTYLPLSRLYQASNHVPFQMKVALLGRPELYGVLPVPLTINPSVGAVPILAFCLETSHLIDGKSETGVSDVEYLGPWPLLQTEKSTSEPSCPPKTNKSWNIEYSIRKLDDAEGQRLYTACKERRRRKYESLQETDEWRQQFLNMMSKWSARGRKEKKLAERIFRGTRLKEFRK